MKQKSFISGIILLSFFLLLASCEKEKPLSEALIGKWEVITMNQLTFENNVKKAEIIIYLSEGEMTYQFIEGGSGILYDGVEDEDFLFSWSLTGSQLTLSNLFTEDLVVDATVDNDLLTWSYKENDPLDNNKSYEFIFTSKRVD